MQVRDRRDDEAPRLGLTATRKIGNAVTRNRARRRMRAAASQRLSLRARPGHDYVLIARHNTASRPWQGLVDDLDRLIADHEKQLQ